MKLLKKIVTFCLIFALFWTTTIPASALTNPRGSTSGSIASPNQIVLPPEGGGSTCGLSRYTKYTYSTYYLDYYYYNKNDSVAYAQALGTLSLQVTSGIAATVVVLNAIFAAQAILAPISLGANLMFVWSAYRTAAFYMDLQNQVNNHNGPNNCGTITVLKRSATGTSLVGVYSQGN